VSGSTPIHKAPKPPRRCAGRTRHLSMNMRPRLLKLPALSTDAFAFFSAGSWNTCKRRLHIPRLNSAQGSCCPPAWAHSLAGNPSARSQGSCAVFLLTGTSLSTTTADSAAAESIALVLGRICLCGHRQAKRPWHVHAIAHTYESYPASYAAPDRLVGTTARSHNGIQSAFFQPGHSARRAADLFVQRLHCRHGPSPGRH
jgi:hypothetical protein